MATATPSEAMCPGCGKRFRLRSEAAGKKVKCNCGVVFIATLVASAEAEVPPKAERGELELDEPPPLPALPPPRSAINPATPTAPTRLSPVMEALAARADDARLSPFREYWLPLALLATGAAVHVLLWSRWLPSPGVTALVVGCALGAQVLAFAPAMLGSLTLAARWFDVSLGSFAGIVWKAAALTLGPAAVADVLFAATLVLSNFDWEIVAAGFGFYLVLYGVPTAILFEMGVAETAFMVAINFVPRIITMYLAGAVIQNMGWMA